MVLYVFTVQDSIVNNQIFKRKKPFVEESNGIQIELILKWLKIPQTDKLEIRNITTYLSAMKFNGYLRLFEIDMLIVKPLMTDISWELFEDFQSKHLNDVWMCPICDLPCKSDSTRWKCVRCLYWYHNACAKPQLVTKNSQNVTLFDVVVETYELCLSCFFDLS